MPARQTILEVPILRLLFVYCQDLDGVPVAVHSVCGPDIEDRRCSATPKAVSCHVAKGFWQYLCASAVSEHLVGVDKWFRDDGRRQCCSTETVPFPCHIIVMEEDQSANLACSEKFLEQPSHLVGRVNPIMHPKVFTDFFQ